MIMRSVGLRRLEIISLGLMLLFSMIAPAFCELLWLDLYRMKPQELQSSDSVPQPPDLLLGCRLPGCFPGYSTQEKLRLKLSARGPFLRSWALGLSTLSPAERAQIRVENGAQVLTSGEIRLSREATIANLNPEHLEMPSLPVIVDLDLEKLRKIASGEHAFPLGERKLTLEIRQLVGDGKVEVGYWSFTYDFSAFISVNDTLKPFALGQDRIQLQGYAPEASPIVLVSRGEAGERFSQLYESEFSMDVDDFTAAAKNPEIAVWSFDHLPLLDLAPPLRDGSDLIPEKAPEMLELTPDLFLPEGNVALGLSWEAFARCHFAIANRILNRARVGVRLLYPLSTQRANSGAVGEFCDGLPVLRSQGTLAERRWNIFYAATNSISRNCCREGSPEVIFVTKSARPTTLAHELGHSLGLLDFEVSGNLMLAGYSSRSKLTLQQVYLGVFSEESIINSFRLRRASVRPGGICPVQCRQVASELISEECVSSGVSFPEVSGNLVSPIEALLMALESDESVSELISPLAFFSLPDSVLFLQGVAEKGARVGGVAREFIDIHSRLNIPECPSNPAYEDLYKIEAIAASRRAAVDALFILRTPQARAALNTVKQSAPKDLREYIEDLFAKW